jgi:hypothetical protein
MRVAAPKPGPLTAADYRTNHAAGVLMQMNMFTECQIARTL